MYRCDILYGSLLLYDIIQIQIYGRKSRSIIRYYYAMQIKSAVEKHVALTRKVPRKGLLHI